AGSLSRNQSENHGWLKQELSRNDCSWIDNMPCLSSGCVERINRNTGRRTLLVQTKNKAHESQRTRMHQSTLPGSQRERPMPRARCKRKAVRRNGVCCPKASRIGQNKLSSRRSPPAQT
ncbi:unnamed protein product, partial [Ectocarpus sp. 6 AP-2014]